LVSGLRPDGPWPGRFPFFFWFFLFPFSAFYFEILTNIWFLFLQEFVFMTLHKIPLILYWYKMLY
jgi:hypothetical protein